MAFVAFPAELARFISKQSKKTTKDRVKKAQFGDGYLQVADDGINATVESWNLVFEPLENTTEYAYKTAMDNWLAEYKCTKVFLWTPPGESVAKKWSRVENTLDQDLLSTEAYVIKFTITQRFDLG